MLLALALVPDTWVATLLLAWALVLVAWACVLGWALVGSALVGSALVALVGDTLAGSGWVVAGVLAQALAPGCCLTSCPSRRRYTLLALAQAVVGTVSGWVVAVALAQAVVGTGSGWVVAVALAQPAV